MFTGFPPYQKAKILPIIYLKSDTTFMNSVQLTEKVSVRYSRSKIIIGECTIVLCQIIKSKIFKK